MGQVTIVIDRREYAITCDDGQEGHIIKLSRMLDEKARALSSRVGQINENMVLAMVGLLLADELQDLKAGLGIRETPSVDWQGIDSSNAAKIDAQTAKISELIKDIKPL